MANDARESLKPKRTAAVMTTFFVALTLVSIALFQNCSPAGSERVEENFGGKSGNGDIYSGFRFVELVRSGLCSDGTNVNAIIYVNEFRQLFLERDNCADLEPRILSSSQARIDDGLVFYDGRVFEPQKESVTQPPEVPTSTPVANGLKCQSISPQQAARCSLEKALQLTLDLDSRTQSGVLSNYADCVGERAVTSPVRAYGEWSAIQLEGMSVNEPNLPLRFNLSVSRADLRGQITVIYQGQSTSYAVTCTNR